MSKISDFTRLITKGTTPMTIGGRFIDSGVNFIKVESITESSTLEYKYLQKISNDINKKMKRSQLRENDLLVTIAGALGRTYIVEKNILPANTNQAVGIIRFNTEKCNPHYVKYWLHTSWIKKLIGNVNAQSIQNNLNLVNLGEIPLNNEDIMDQQKIASVLSALDSKIELNNKINTELESMAKTLYDYWFVQFDFPDEKGKTYKSSGGEMVYNEKLKRDVPKGWEVKNILEIVEWIGGAQPPKSTFKYKFTNGYIRFIQNRDYADSRNLTYIPITDRNKVCDEFDIMMDKYGEAGKVRYGLAGAYNVALSRIKIKLKNGQEYIRKYFESNSVNMYLSNACMASTRASLNEETLSNLYITIPKNEVLERFEKTQKNIIKMILHNQTESSRLTELRDWLLPMLMNGQVKVN